eukprot:107371-Lingulodinium_polyedra.AAC.1
MRTRVPAHSALPGLQGGGQCPRHHWCDGRRRPVRRARSANPPSLLGPRGPPPPRDPPDSLGPARLAADRGEAGRANEGWERPR